MAPLAYDFLPIVLLFLAGIALRRVGVLDKTHGTWLLQVVVYVALPALTLSSVSRIPLNFDLALVPVAGALTVLCIWPLALRVGKALALPPRTLGVFVTGPLIMNLAVEYPFVLAGWGKEGVARLALFEFGSALLVMTLVYAQAGWYSAEGAGKPGATVRKLLRFPPFVALLLALLVNASGIPLPEAGLDALQRFGGVLALLVLLALGIHFEVPSARIAPLMAGIVLRTAAGLAVGLLWVQLFAFEGITRAVVLFAVAAPVGFNTLVFAAAHRLDTEFAASLASVSLLLALLYLPVLLNLLG